MKVLSDVAAAIVGRDLADKLEQRYSTFVTGKDNETGSFSRQLAKLTNDVFAQGSNGCEDHPVMKTLKAVNQSIIAPAVIELRLSICPSLPFKDTSGWQVHIIVNDETVIVQHSKRQNHRDARKVEEAFEFEWTLTMTFSRDLTKCTDMALSITELSFGPNTVIAKKEEYQRLFKDYLRPCSNEN